jgi:hypothetical protein
VLAANARGREPPATTSRRTLRTIEHSAEALRGAGAKQEVLEVRGRFTGRRRTSSASIGSGRSAGSRRSPIRATARPEPSSNSIHGWCASGGWPSRRTGWARYAAAGGAQSELFVLLREWGIPVSPYLKSSSRGRGAIAHVQCLGSEAADAGLRDRRTGVQGGPVRSARSIAQHESFRGLGDRVQVRGRTGAERGSSRCVSRWASGDESRR